MKFNPFIKFCVGVIPLVAVVFWISCSKDHTSVVPMLPKIPPTKPSAADSLRKADSLKRLDSLKTAYAFRANILNDYNTNYLMPAKQLNFFWNGDRSTCNPGTLSNDVQAKALQRINYFRRQAGIADNMALDTAESRKCQLAALIITSNDSLSHFPPSSSKCYTVDGHTASGKSNLAFGFADPLQSITAYMDDFGSSNTAVGHRRWILYQYAQTFGHGATGNADALWVIGNFKTTLPANSPAFVAWPPATYIPRDLVFGRWSFAVDKGDFTNASITMQDSNGKNILYTVEPLSKNTYGDNTMVWTPTLNLPNEVIVQNGVPPNKDQTISVVISNVMVKGAPVNYKYKVIVSYLNAAVGM